MHHVQPIMGCVRILSHKHHPCVTFPYAYLPQMVTHRLPGQWLPRLIHWITR